MDNTALKIANALALRVLDGKRWTSYPELATEIGWRNLTGHGLGRQLEKVLIFCAHNNLPILTSIVCKKDTRRPSEAGLTHMHGYFGEFNLEDEQQKVFDYDWRLVSELQIPGAMRSGIDFMKLFATRGFGFDTQEWGMLAFSREGFRDNVLELMRDNPIHVVCFCSPNNPVDEQGNPAMAPSIRGRVLGIAEIQPKLATPDTHIQPQFRRRSVAQWGKDRWPFGLEMSRAWRFVHTPFTKDALPVTSKDPWGPTNAVINVTSAESAALSLYELEEVPVYGQERDFM